MKSAYELAMERLNKQSPTVKLTDAQKKKLAELDSIYAARIAEKEIQIKDEMARVAEAGDADALDTLEKRLVSERRSFLEQLENKKDEVRKRPN